MGVPVSVPTPVSIVESVVSTESVESVESVEVSAVSAEPVEAVVSVVSGKVDASTVVSDKKPATLVEKFKKLAVYEFWLMNKIVETDPSNSVLYLSGLSVRSILPIEDQIMYYTKYEEDYKEETKKYKKFVKELNTQMKVAK